MTPNKRPSFDPRIFISQPYVSCPMYKNNDCYGVLNVHDIFYTRRCRECWYTNRLSLPKLHKKIIYLDQFVISEMMKAINSKLGKKDKVDPFYITLFEKLEMLTRAQLITCPDSSFHKDESLSSKYYDALKQMYEHLSDGATFYDPQTIHRFQIQERYKAFRNSKRYAFKAKAEQIINSAVGLHSWRSNLRVSADFKITEDEIEDARNGKLKTYNDIADIFNNRWKLEKDKTIKDWFREEGLAYGDLMVRHHLDNVIKQGRFNAGAQDVSADELLRIMMSESSVLMTSLLGNPKPEEMIQEYNIVVSFLKSELMLQVPFNRLNALLWACVADSAAHGGKQQPPNAGTPNDIEMISTLLPYCDAIFIDKPMYAILSHGEVNKETSKYQAKIFSLQSKEEFLKYLDDILKSASKLHMNKVKEVYGEKWDQPYWSMYEREK